MQARPQFTTVAVYCASSNAVHPEYLACARDLGARIARSGRQLVYGGGRVGLMGETARACREAGGRVIGVITERLASLEQMDPDNHENVVVQTMRERKKLIEHRADAMIVLPGGLGTMEEFFEVLVGRLLGEHDKPIVILNSVDPNYAGSPSVMPIGPAGAGVEHDPHKTLSRASGERLHGRLNPGFYDPLLSMIEHMIESKFAKPGVRALFEVCRTAGEAMSALERIERDGIAKMDKDLLTPSARE